MRIGDIEVDLRENARARRINITVHRGGIVRVTKPRRASMREIERFIAQSREWIMRMKKRVESLSKTSRIESSKKEYGKYKKEALALAKGRIAHFSKTYGVAPQTVSIRNQKSRWGSCSHRGLISLNYRIVFLPPELADYIIVHELCHLREMNHSRRFWEIVAQEVPEYRERRMRLRSLERHLLLD